MGGSMSRSKGQRGEREVIGLLQPVVIKVYGSLGLEPPKLERNLMQTARGGYDILGLEWLALEVKRHETLAVESWWQQCLRQARQDQDPVLLYRKNRCPWRVRMYGYLLPGGGLPLPVDIALDGFLSYVQGRLERELRGALQKGLHRK